MTSIAGQAETLLKEAFETDVDLTELLSRILDVMLQLTRAERAFIVLAEPDGTPYARVVHNIPEHDLPEAGAEISRTILRRVLESGETVLLGDASSSPSYDQAGSIHRMALRSVICAPLTADAGCLGAIYFENRSLIGVFEEEDRQRAEQLAGTISRRLATYLAMRSLVQV